MEAADYEVLSVREQLFHDRVRECIVSAGPGREGAGRAEVGGARAAVGTGSPAAPAPSTSVPEGAGAGAGMANS